MSLPLTLAPLEGVSAPEPVCELSYDQGLSLLDMAPHHRVLDMYGSGQQRMHLMSAALDERGELVANIMGALSLESLACATRLTMSS